jgi:hypothetical protein
MDFISHQGAQALVNQLVSLKRSLAGEFIADNNRLKVRIVISHNADFRQRQSGFYQPRNFYGIHGINVLEVSARREV